MAKYFDPIIAQMDAERAGGNMFAARDADPEKVARANKISRALDVPADLVDGDPDGMDHEVQLRAAKRNNVAFPTIGMFQADPRNAAVSKDDFGALLKNAKYWLKATSSFGNLQAAPPVAPTFENVWEGLKTRTAEGFKQLPRQIGKIFRETGPGSIRRRMDYVASGRFDEDNAAYENSDALIRSTTPYFGDDAIGKAAELSYGALGSIAQQSPGLAAALFVPGGQGIGLGMMATQVGAPAYSKYRSRGASPGMAFVGGGIEGGAEAAFEATPLAFFVGNLGKVGFKSFLTGLLVREVPGEVDTAFVQKVTDAAIANPNMTLGQFADELPAEIADTVGQTIIQSLLMGGAGYGMGRVAKRGMERARAEQAEADASFLEGAVEAQSESLTAGRDPSAWAQFLRYQAEGTPVETVYVPAEKLVEFYQSENIDPADAEHPFKFMPDFAAKLAEAAASGGEIAIPTADFIAHVGPTKAFEALKDEVTVRPGGVSRSEARAQVEARKADQDEFVALGEEVRKQAEEAAAANEPLEALRQSIVDRLVAIGEPQSVAETQAAYVVMKAATRAERMGKELPTEINIVDQDGRLVRGDLSPSQRKKGKAAPKAKEPAGEAVAPEIDGLTLDQGPPDRSKLIQQAKALGVDAASIPELRELEGMIAFRQTLGEKMAERMEQSRLAVDATRAEGKLPFEVGTRFTTAHSRDRGLAPWTVTGYFVDAKNPDRYGYRVERGDRSTRDSDESDYEASQLLVSDPAADARRPEYDRAADVAGWQPFTGLRSMEQGATDGGQSEGAGPARSEQAGDRGGRYSDGEIAPLAGSPAVEGGGPNLDLIGVAERYAASIGIPLPRQSRYVEIDEDRATRLAEAYAAMEHAPNDPAVQAAYVDLAKQTLAQYQALIDAGYTFSFTTDPEYVSTTPFNAIRDLRDNKHMGVYPSADGFGSDDTFDASDSPLLLDTGIRWMDSDGEARRVLFNDLFRAVHDAFGHGLEGAGFRARGEENAWQAHARLFTGPALAALTSETRGQNSWLNYGPHGEHNRKAKVEDTIFADQKTGLLPPWAWQEGFDDGTTSYEQASAPAADRGSDRGDQAGAANDDGAAEELTAPPVNEDGTVTIQHWSPAGELTVSDPTRWGQRASNNRFNRMSREERSRISKAPGRTYFGIGHGQPGGYVGEFGPEDSVYDAAIPLDRLYDMDADPDGLKAKGGAFPVDAGGWYDYQGRKLDGRSLYEQLIKDAGYAGYWIKNDRLGMVAAVYEPVELTPAEDQRQLDAASTFYQDQSFPYMPPFYSALEAAIDKSQMTRAPAKQWKQTLLNTPGIKEEEMRWSGLLDVLDIAEKADEPITKDALLEAVREGGVQVSEVVLGEVDQDEVQLRAGQIEDEEWRRQEDDAFSEWDASHWVEEVEDDEGVRGYIVRGPYANSDLPYPDEESAQDTADSFNDDERQEALAQFEPNFRGMDFEEMARDEIGGGTEYESYADPSKPETYRELLLTLPSGMGGNPTSAPSTHWDEPGVVAHVRFSEEATTDGERVLFLHEIQSDWHQKGRTEGYRQKGTIEALLALKEKMEAAERAQEEAEKEVNDKRDAATKALLAEGVEVNYNTRFRELLDTDPEFAAAMGRRTIATLAAREARDEYYRAGSGGIPDAPFRNSWADLAMKRMIRWAVDNGFERIAWIRGDQQNGGQTGQDDGVAFFYENILPKQVGKLIKKYDGKVEGVLIYNRTMNDLRRRIAAHERLIADQIAQGLSVGEDVQPELTALQSAINEQSDVVSRAREASESDARGETAVAQWEALTIARDDMRRLEGEQTDARQRFEAPYRMTKLKEDLAEIEKPNSGFTITPKMAEAALSGFLLFQKSKAGPRGRVMFPAGGLASGPATIQLFAGLDRSTFMHEMGHVWLEELRQDASDPTAPQQVRDDYQIVLDWFAANGTKITADQPIPRDAHELWARGTERYLMEGKSPSIALRGAFNKMRAWMLAIYQVVKNLKAPITPEIRGVMDRLLATDAEIEAAREEQQVKAAYASREDAPGMTDEEFATYERLVMEARDEAFDALLYRTMSAIRRERTAAWKAEYAQVYADMAEAVDAMPEFRALAMLTAKEGRVTLPRQWLIDTYGAGILDELPQGVPPIHAMEGASDAQSIAELAGMSTADELIQNLRRLQTRKQQLLAAGDKRSVKKAMIQDESKAVMADRHGDILSDGSIEEEALSLIHNGKQGEVLAVELKELGKRSNKRPTPYMMARQWARDFIGRSIVNDAVSGSAMQRYRKAARIAAQKAEEAMLADDLDEAFRFKQHQMLNNALIDEAHKVRDAIDSAVVKLRKVAKRQTMKTVDQAYLDLAHGLLENVDMRDRSQRQIDRQESFESWANARAAEGYDVAVPATFELTLGQKNWSRLQVQQLLDLREAVDQIIHIGRQKQELIDNKEKRDREAMIAEIVDRIGQLPPKPPKPNVEPGFWGRIVKGAVGMHADLTKMSRLMFMLDNRRTDGPLHRLVWRPLSEALATENDMVKAMMTAMSESVDAVPPEVLKTFGDLVTIPELPDPASGDIVWSRMQMHQMARNAGNEGNWRVLCEGMGWNQEQAMAALDREMTKAEWEYVQRDLDYVGSLWPMIEAQYKRLNGIAPPKVDPKPIVTRHGTFPGGYYPLVPDSTRNPAVEQKMGTDELFDVLHTKALTRNGFTKERSGADYIVSLAPGISQRHMVEVIHDLTHREALMQADRIMSHPRVVQAIRDTMGLDMQRQVRPWLKAIANQYAVDKRPAQAIEAFANGARTHMSIVGMGYRINTMLTQLAGYTNSIEALGTDAEVWFGSGFKSVAGMGPKVALDFAMERSGVVRHRLANVDLTQEEQIKKLAGQRGMASNIKRFAFYGIGIMDRVVILPTWHAAYNKAMFEGKEEADAIAFADHVLEQSQGGAGIMNTAAIQRQKGLASLFVMFYSYASAYYNRQAQLARDTGDAVRERRTADFPRLLARAFWLMIGPNIAVTLLGGLMGGGPDDDESYAGWLIKGTLGGMFMGIPVAGSAISSWAKGFNFSASPLDRAVTTGYKAVIDLWHIVDDVVPGVDGEDTEPSDRALRNAIESVGYLTGQPLGQPGATAQFLFDWGRGEADPDGVHDWWVGLTTGKLDDD